MTKDEIVQRYTQLLIRSGKYPQQDITGYRAIEILEELIDDLELVQG